MYIVNIVDTNGCFINDSIFLEDPTPLVSSYTTSGTNGYSICANGTDGIIDLTISGSVPSYICQWSNGIQGQSLYNLSAGLYYYTITDLNGCITSDSVLIAGPILNISDSVNHVSCAGGIDGSVFVTVSGETSPYYIFWDNNINTAMLEAGVYSYQVIDDIGCVYDNTITVNEPLPFTVVEQATDILCFGDNDGAISLIITGATPPYSINWFGYNTFGMQAGTYNFTIVDSNNCQYSEIVIITEPNPIDVTFSITSPSCLNSTDGMVALSVIGGVSPYTENWSGYDPNLLAVGAYEIVVVDSNSCADTNNITLVPLSDMLVLEQSYNVTCEGFCDGSTDLSVNNGVLPYQSDWFGYDADSLCPGVFFFEISDGLGCVYSDSVLITSPDSLDLSITENNGVLSASVIGGTPPISYSWFNAVNSLGSGQDLNVSYVGDYYCIAYDSQHCNSDTAFHYYGLNPLGVADFSDFGLDGFLLYPNPTDGILNIEFSTHSNIDFEVNIIDIIGQYIRLDSQEVFSGTYKKDFDLSSFVRGMYFISIKINNEYINKKIVIR
jgi:hypothetical protein